MNIDQNAMRYISMDLSQRILQTNVKLFSNFELIFNFWQKTENFDRKLKNIQTNSEAWILIKVQCVIYQWIRLEKPYKVMESFFLKLTTI